MSSEIHDCVRRTLNRYFRDLDGQAPHAIHAILRSHLADLYAFYGEETGAKIARKHISWYTKGIAGAARFRHAMNQLTTMDAQLAATDEFFLAQAANEIRYEAAA